MQIVIDIPDYDYEQIKEYYEKNDTVEATYSYIYHGTPLPKESCTDAISREDALQALCKAVHKNDDAIPCLNQRVSCLWNKTKVQDYAEEILKLPPVTPVEKVGKWQKISDYRYQCSRCGNVVHFSSEENLYRFSRWCGKCGSNNDRGQVE